MPLGFRVPPEKQVAEALAHPKGEPAAGLVLFAVVQHVAALAESRKISQPVISGVMIEMSCSQHHFGRKGRHILW